MRKKIAMLGTKLIEGERTIIGKNEEITTLRNELEENKELIQELSNEIGNNNELNEAITTENEALKADRTNKSKTIERCTTPVRNTKKNN